MAVKKYYYDAGFRTYIKQVMRLLSGFQINQKDILSRVPVHYGDMDRIVANILHKDGVFIPSNIPIITIIVD